VKIKDYFPISNIKRKCWYWRYWTNRKW